MLMAGPPGAGKTLLARALPSILPRMTIDEALDMTRVYSVADRLPGGVPLVQDRPFRAPHHTISHPGPACNADMQPSDVRKYCKLDDAGLSLMRSAIRV